MDWTHPGWATLFGLIGAALKIAVEEWQAGRQHHRDIDFAKIDAKTAPLTVGSSRTAETVETALDKAVQDEKKAGIRVPAWVRALRGSMRSWLSFATLGVVSGGFVYLLRHDRENPMFTAAFETLLFLTVLAFTFYFGTRVARK